MRLLTTTVIGLHRRHLQSPSPSNSWGMLGVSGDKSNYRWWRTSLTVLKRWLHHLGWIQVILVHVAAALSLLGQL